MYSRSTVLVLLCALVATTLAIQCSDVTSKSTCSKTIDDRGIDCVWCARMSDTCSCVLATTICSSYDCPNDGGGSGGNSDLSGGEIAGVVIGVLAACCCCLCIGAVIVAIIVAAVVLLTRRGATDASAA